MQKICYLTPIQRTDMQRRLMSKYDKYWVRKVEKQNGQVVGRSQGMSTQLMHQCRSFKQYKNMLHHPDANPSFINKPTYK